MGAENIVDLLRIANELGVDARKHSLISSQMEVDFLFVSWKIKYVSSSSPDGVGHRARLDPSQQRPAQTTQIPAGERLKERGILVSLPTTGKSFAHPGDILYFCKWIHLAPQGLCF